MRRLLALSVLLVPAAIAAPPPPPKPAADSTLYFPTEKGTKWVYDRSGKEEALVLTAVENKGEEKHVTVSMLLENGQQFTMEKWAVSKKALVFLGPGGQAKLDRPICRLRLPVKPGEKWDVHASGEYVLEEKGTYTVGGIEELEVPAGKFKAVRVEIEVKERGGAALATPTRSRRWYAPGVGLVKMEVENPKGVMTRILKSFTRGGAKK